MIKIVNFKVVASCIAFLALFSCKLNMNVGGCTGRYQLDGQERKQIEFESKRVLAYLRGQEYGKIWKNSHSAFKEAVSLDQLNSYSSILSKRLIFSDEPKILDYRLAKSLGSSAGQIYCGGVDPESVNHLRIPRPEGISTLAIAFIQLPTKPVERVLTLRLAEERNNLKLLHFDLSAVSFNGKDTKHYEDLGDRWLKNDLMLPAYLAYQFSLFYARSGEGIETSKTIRITNKLAKLVENEEYKKATDSWRYRDKDYKIIDIEIVENISDVAPVIKYISHTNLESDKVQKEVDQLYSYFIEKYPGVGREFESFLFVAYKGLPEEPNKSYEVYKVVKSFEKENGELIKEIEKNKI